MVISGEIRPRAQYFDKMLKFRKTSLKFCSYFAKHSQKIAEILHMFRKFRKTFAKYHIVMTISVKFWNLLPKCYQNANICKISLNFRWLCYRNPKFCWYQDRNAGMPLYFVEKVVIYRRNFGKIKSPENPPYLEKKFAKYRLWPRGKFTRGVNSRVLTPCPNQNSDFTFPSQLLILGTQTNLRNRLAPIFDIL